MDVIERFFVAYDSVWADPMRDSSYRLRSAGFSCSGTFSSGGGQ
jgi:hypothetical protein